MAFLTREGDRTTTDLSDAVPPVDELDFLSASFRQNVEDSLGGATGRFIRRGIENFTGMNDYPAESTLTAEQLNNMYPDIGLKFTKPMPQPMAQELYAEQMEERERRDIIERGKQQNGINKIIDPALGLGIGIADPTNILLGDRKSVV